MPKTKKKCIPCLGSELKVAILAALKDTGTKAVVTEMPECDDSHAADFCYLPRGKMGSKRARSAYTEFASKCMKEKNGKGKSAPEVMKECALRWKELKGKPATAPKPSLASSLQPL